MSSQDSDENYDLVFKIVLVGDVGVGKTCVVQRFKSGLFMEKQGNTIGVDFTMKTLDIQGKRVKVRDSLLGLLLLCLMVIRLAQCHLYEVCKLHIDIVTKFPSLK